MQSRERSLDTGRLIRVAAALSFLAVTALAFIAPSDSLRATLVTFLVVVGLVYAGWHLSASDDEQPEPIAADD